jgi:hypothetical protein
MSLIASYYNMTIIKVDDTSLKNDKIKKCWFCDAKCYNFVCICENCKYEKYTKIKNKKLKF